MFGWRIIVEQRFDEPREGDSMSQKTEAPMETPIVQATNKVTPAATCTHERLIDDVLTRGGKRTGKVRCRECGAVFSDPYRPEA
jgi:hypothetical protein